MRLVKPLALGKKSSFTHIRCTTFTRPFCRDQSGPSPNLEGSCGETPAGLLAPGRFLAPGLASILQAASPPGINAAKKGCGSTRWPTHRLEAVSDASYFAGGVDKRPVARASRNRCLPPNQPARPFRQPSRRTRRRRASRRASRRRASSRRDDSRKPRQVRWPPRSRSASMK